MIIKKSKIGQFYIIAAVIIIFVIIGFAGISNYLTIKQEPQRFYDISKILRSEGPQIVTYGLYAQKDISEEIGNFTGIFNNYINQPGNSEILNVTIVYGDINNAHAVQLSRVPAGSVSFDFATTKTEVSDLGSFQTEAIPIIGIIKPNQVVLNVSGAPISYNLSEGQNFFFVMTTSEGFSQYVESSQNLQG